MSERALVRELVCLAQQSKTAFFARMAELFPSGIAGSAAPWTNPPLDEHAVCALLTSDRDLLAIYLSMTGRQQYDGPVAAQVRYAFTKSLQLQAWDAGWGPRPVWLPPPSE